MGWSEALSSKTKIDTVTTTTVSNIREFTLFTR